jgi:type IV fimbrial biogenesis protein FimT
MAKDPILTTDRLSTALHALPRGPVEHCPAGPPPTRNARHNAHRPHAPGVTLIELLVTLAVLAILVVVGIPSMAEMLARHRLKTAAQALVEDLQWSRSEAIRRNAEVYLTIDTGAWCYSVATLRDCGCGASDQASGGACRQPADAPPLLKVVSGDAFPGVRISSHTFGGGRPVAAFEPRRALAVQSGSLTLASDQGVELRVVLSLLGRVRLCSPGGSLWGYPSC